MMLKQLSVFVENKTGSLSEPCRDLARAGIDIMTLSLADTEQFGIMRLIVRDWRRAEEALLAAGHVVKVSDVVAMEVDDRPGGLADLLEAFEQASLDIEYMYACTYRGDGKAVLVFRFEDTEAAISKLRERGLTPIAHDDLFARIGGAAS